MVECAGRIRHSQNQGKAAFLTLIDDVTVELLEDLHEFGAEAPEQLYGKYGQAQVDHRLQARYLAQIPTPLGKLFLLGPEGRRTLGLSPFYLSPPEAAATQLIRRRVKERLELESWHYQGKPSRNLMLFVTDEGTRAYVLARYGDYTARSVRRVLASVSSKLIKEGAVLLVWTKTTHRLLHLEQKTNGLLIIRTLDFV